MKLLVFVLNRVDKLDEFLLELSNSGVKGATILTSMGMAKSLCDSNKGGSENIIINSLRVLLSNTDDENKTIFTAVDEEQEKIFYDVVDKVIGPISKENTGIIFTMPICSIYGLPEKGV